MIQVSESNESPEKRVKRSILNSGGSQGNLSRTVGRANTGNDITVEADADILDGHHGYAPYEVQCEDR